MKRLAIRSLCAALPLLLAGCDAWPIPDQNPDRTNHNSAETTITAANVDQLDQKWTWVDDTLGPASVSRPVASRGGIHVTAGCFVVTLAPATGGQNWATPVADDQFSCEAPAGGDMSEPFTAPTEDGGTSVLANYGYVVPSGLQRPWEFVGKKLDAVTGEVLSTTTGVSLAEALRGTEIAGTNDQQGPFLLPLAEMDVVDTAGSYGRGFTTATHSNGIAPSRGSATIGTGDLVFHSGPGAMTTAAGTSSQGLGVRAYSKSTPRTGCLVPTPHPTFPTVDLECPVWVNPLDGTFPSGSVLDNASGTLYVTSAGGNLYAIDQATGATLWSAAGVRTRPALADGTLYAGTSDGRILAFAAAGCGSSTCSPSGEFDTGSGVGVGQPVVAGEVIYAAAGSSVYGFAKAGCAGTCTPLWSDATGSSTLSAPVVNRGQLYVSTGTSLIAYGLPG